MRMSKCTAWIAGTREDEINAGERIDTHKLAWDIPELEISNHWRSEALELFLDRVRIQD